MTKKQLIKENKKLQKVIDDAWDSMIDDAPFCKDRYERACFWTLCDILSPHRSSVKARGIS